MEEKEELMLSKIVEGTEKDYKDVYTTELKTPVDIIDIEIEDPECFVLVSNINTNFFLCKNPKITPEEYIQTENKTKYMAEIKPGERLIGYKVPDPFKIEDAKRIICTVKSVRRIHNYSRPIKISIETGTFWAGTRYHRTCSLIGHKDTVVMSNPGEKPLKKFLHGRSKPRNPRAIDVHKISDLKGGTHFGNRVTEEWIIEK